MSGYQRLKMAPNSPSSVFTRVCHNKCGTGFGPLHLFNWLRVLRYLKLARAYTPVGGGMA